MGVTIDIVEYQFHHNMDELEKKSIEDAWLTTIMIVSYALLVIEDAFPSTYREAEISSKSEMWKEAMLEEMNSLHKNSL